MSRKNPKNLQKEKNPIQARREQLGMTQLILHGVADVSYHTVQRIEQGLMPSVPERIYNALYGRVAGSPTLIEVNFAVESWKVSTRRANKRYLDWALENPETWFNWLELRKGISESKAGFCKLYCIHPHVLDHFEAEEKVFTRDRLAEKIRNAFLDAGIGEDGIKAIEDKLIWGSASEKMSG